MNRWVLGAGVLLGLVIGGVLGVLELRSDRAGATGSTTTEVRAKRHGQSDEGAARALVAGPGTRVVHVDSVYPGTDPTREDYDAFKSSLLGLDAADIFASEPREPDWAEPMEERLLQVVGSDFDLLFGGQVRHVECRSSTCRIAIEVDQEHRDRAFQFLQVLPFGNSTSPSTSPGEDGTVLIRGYSILARENRGLSEHEAWYRDMRRKRLEFIGEDGLISDEEAAALESVPLP